MGLQRMRVRSLVIELDQNLSVLSQVLGVLADAQLRCESVDYANRGLRWLAVIDAQISDCGTLDAVLKRIAALAGVHSASVLANAEEWREAAAPANAV